MKKAIIKLYTSFEKQLKNICWNRQVVSIKKNIFRKEIDVLEDKGKYLILLPHVDDEWIGASSLITNDKYEVILCNMDMPGGDSVELHSAREKELTIIAQTYNRKICKYNGDLKTIIERIKPRFVLIPFLVDWHAEHIKVMKILYDYLIKDNNYSMDIVMYQVSIPIQDRYINRISGLSSEEWNDKWRKFKEVYISQINIPYKRFACNERISGSLIDSFAAEVFVKLDSKEWMSCYRQMVTDGKDYSYLKKHINDLQRIRLMVKNITVLEVD